jgi:hypothetical protein
LTLLSSQREAAKVAIRGVKTTESSGHEDVARVGRTGLLSGL